MKHLINFDLFLFENESLSGSDIAEYISEISPDGSKPDYFIEKYVLPNRFTRKKIDIRDLLNSDPDFKEYIESNVPRYSEEDQIDEDGIHLPIVVYNGMVIDGYNRGLINYINGDYNVSAYVNE